MLKNFNAVKITVASPEDIMSWSHGEVTKAETINYRTFKSEPGGLMAEEIFGPTKDYQCYCGKYKGIRYKGIVCDRCGVEVTHKRVRRSRMGHIDLAAPVAHVWFANGVPNKLASILDIPQKKLQTVIYYARYVVTGVEEDKQNEALESLKELKKAELEDLGKQEESKLKEVGSEFKLKKSDAKKENKEKKKQTLQLERIENQEKKELAKVKSAFKQRADNTEKRFSELKALISSMKIGTTISEDDNSLLEEYDMFFYDAGMGAEAIKELLENLDVSQVIEELNETIKTTKSQLKKSKAIQRLRIFKGIEKSGLNPAHLILSVIPVIPPDLRPIIQLPGGRFATYDLNDLYRRVINRNNRLKRLINLGAPEIILRNEKRMLQESVDSLLDNNHKPGNPSLNSRQQPYKSLSDLLRGKQGRFRQNLLGKRVDYSGRAVIVGGPELRFDECGLPKNVALELFRPFIIRELIGRGEAANPTRAKQIFEAKEDLVWDILEEVIQERPVLLNRAPSLHRYSILAFYPKLVEGNAIRLHPMVTTGFNADFDGDQMAVHVPLSDQAVEEVKKRMFAKDNMLSLRDATPIVNVAKDMAMGIYFLTLMRDPETGNGIYELADVDTTKITKIFSSRDEILSALDLGEIKFYEPIRTLRSSGEETITTTAGRVLFNDALPTGYEYINKAMGKSDVSKVTSDIFRTLGNEEAIKSLDIIKDLGFQYSMIFGYSVSMGDFRFGGDEILEKMIKEYEGREENLMEDYYEGMVTENELKKLKQGEWLDYTDQIQDEIWEKAQKADESKGLVELDQSGAVPVSSWLKQIAGVRGSVTNMDGEIVNLPLTGNFATGLDNFEYFAAAKAVRKSMSDVALKTAESGYLTRRLVDVSQDIITKVEDCGTKEGIVVPRESDRIMSFADRLQGRVLSKDLKDGKKIIAKRNDLITVEMAAEIEANKNVEEVEVRSPLKCNITHGLCQRCYGVDNGTGEMIEIGEAVGIIAAQSLGEPTTQLTLKSKSDARANKSDVTQGLPRVEELLEARTPKALAELADFAGKVSIIEDKKKIVVRVTAKQKHKEEFEIGEKDEVMVKDKASVKAKDTLIVHPDRSEERAKFVGKVSVKKDKIVVTADTAREVEKYATSLADVLVADGDTVEQGQQLTFGSIDPKELAKLKEIGDAQEYIIAGVQGVYGIQGLEVDDRHLEIVARQMGRYGLITDSGDTERYLPGDFADALDIELENKRLEEAKKREIKYQREILGVTNSALRTESFLSAASFEQQVRVLTDAAILGKVDHLRGLKENVIIGRPVPLGTELLDNNPEEVEEVKAEAEILANDKE